MYGILRAAQHNYPHFHYFRHLPFATKPIATLALAFTYWLIDRLEIGGDFNEYVVNDYEVIYTQDHFDLSFDSDDMAYQLIDACVNFLDDPMIHVYGNSAAAYYRPFHPDDWLIVVFDHLLIPPKDRKHMIMFAQARPSIVAVESNWPRCQPVPIRLLIDLLELREETKDLAFCLRYVYKLTDNNFADYCAEEMQFDGIDWTTPGIVDEYVGVQQAAYEIYSEFVAHSNGLCDDLDATLDFILPLYGATALIAAAEQGLYGDLEGEGHD